VADATMQVVPDSRVAGAGSAASKVAEYLIDALGEAGVRHMFGVVGGTGCSIRRTRLGWRPLRPIDAMTRRLHDEGPLLG
jgi:hypothetical protein